MKLVPYIISGLMFILALGFIFRSNRLRRENLELKKTLIDVYKDGLMETDQAKEDFIKFISDSREWAFEYIETVQAGLNKFVKEAGPSIDYFDSYGEVIYTPITPQMQKVSEAYKDLLKLLPEEGKNN